MQWSPDRQTAMNEVDRLTTDSQNEKAKRSGIHCQAVRSVVGWPPLGWFIVGASARSMDSAAVGSSDAWTPQLLLLLQLLLLVCYSESHTIQHTLV
jgi:hypothetical protein